MLVSTSFGQISQTFNSSGSFTIPPGVTSITAQVWGAGENGKNDSNYGGGGGGAFAQSTFNVTPGVVYSIDVGSNGYIGGNSSISLSGTPIVRAEGGGQNGYQQGGRASASIGTIRYSGGNGHRSTIYYGGGGGSAGSTGNGSDANLYLGGNGGSGISGDGGNGSSNFPGIGNAPGAGGGEGRYTSSAGASGRVIVTWTCPTTAGTLSGNQYLCRYAPNNTTTFSSTVAGGTWSTANGSIATVNATTGAVTAVSAGTTTITYTIATSGCTTRTASRTVYVANQPGAGPASLSGSQTQCVNSTATYTITPDVYSFNYVWSYQGTGATIAVAPDGLSATVTFGANATSGNMRVQSENACGMDGGGKFLGVTIVPIPSTPPTSNAYSPTCNSFVAQWGYSNDATSYAIDVATDNSFTNILPAYNNYNVGNNRTLTLTGLAPGTTYYYRARGVNACGTGSNSATMSYATSPLPASTPVVTGGTNSNCFNGLTLNWNQVTNATGYYVDISTNSTFSSFVSGYNNYNVGYQTSNAYFGGLSTGVLYYYRIRAYNACGTTASSNVLSFSIGSVGGSVSSAQTICSGTQPTALTLSGHAGSIIRWEKSVDAAFTTPIAIANTSTTLSSSTIGNLDSDTYFRAVVQNGSCSVGYSNSARITVKSPVPGNARADNNATCDGFIARWNTASGNDYYLDIATTSTFDAGTFAPGYNNVNLGAVNNHTVTGLATSTTYYFRVRAVSNTGTPSCTSAYSAVVSKSTLDTTAAPVQTGTSSPTCDGFTLNWNLTGTGSSAATAYYMDVATANTFTPSEIVSGYSNVLIGGVSDRSYVITGLASGTYYTRIRASGPCGLSTNSVTQSGVVNATTAPTMSAVVHPTCSNANGSLSITNYSTANAYTITPSTGVTNNAGSITAPQGAYTITARNITTGCVSTAVNFTINAQPATAATPSLGTTTQPTCVLPTGSVVLNNLPSSGTWTITQTGTVGTSYTGTGTSRTISGLAAGTYNFTVSTATTCVSGSSSTLTIIGLETKTWNGSAWSGSTTGAAAPTLDKHIVFTGNYTAANDIEGCSCQVNAGANVTIQTNRYMKIMNQVVVNHSGSLTFENNASLIQITDVPAIPNSGNITYKRTTTPILKTDYVYWSSPVSGFTLGGIQTGTLYYSYNEPANSWAGAGTSTVMASGIGYIVRGGGTGFDSGTSTISASFIGPPNNGVVSASSTGAGKTSLLGNPYPSALDADAFLLANNSVLEGTLYFWTHNTAIQLADGENTSFGSGKFAYTSDDYATYNFTGGTGTGGQSVSGASQIPDGQIASGVGFFADGAGSGGTVIFNNSMRLKNNTVLSNSQFFKPASGSKTAKTTAVEKNRLWLNLTNAEGAFKQTLLGYITGATNKYDRGYDGVSYDGNSYVDFYSINEDVPLTIQGRALPFDQSDVIPLGYSSRINGEFTISIEKTDGTLQGQDIFLEDKMTGDYTNLKKSSYTFSTSEGTFNDRFTINYISKVTLGTDDFVTKENGVVIFNKNKEITIQSSEELIAKVQVFDVSGKLIIEKSKLNSNETILRNLNLADQVLIVKVVLENGKTISEKIIY